MTADQASAIDQAVEFVESLELPPKREVEPVEGAELPVPPKYDAGVDQTVTIGSQLAGFAANVDAELRPQIANTSLLAQLAANKHIDKTQGSSRAWYYKYIEVLSNIGWLIEGDATTAREIEGTALEVHKEIIPVITAAFGPAASAASTVLSVLNGLAEMDKDQPWITLFEQESQRAKANQFQISYATADGGTPRMTLACFELDASHSVTQVLFFKFAQSHAKLTHFEVKLSMNESVFTQLKPVVAGRIGEYVTDYVAGIEI